MNDSSLSCGYLRQVLYCYAHWGCTSSQIPYQLSVLPYIGGHSLDEFQSISFSLYAFGKIWFWFDCWGIGKTLLRSILMILLLLATWVVHAVVALQKTLVFSLQERAHDGLGFYGESMCRSSFAPSHCWKTWGSYIACLRVSEGESTGFLCLVSFKGDGPHQNNQSRSMTGNYHQYLWVVIAS